MGSSVARKGSQPPCMQFARHAGKLALGLRGNVVASHSHTSPRCCRGSQPLPYQRVMMLKASARAPRLPATGHARRPASLARSQSWEGGQRQSWICHSHNERAESWLCSHGERAELRPALDDALVAYDAGALAEEAGPAIDVLGLGQVGGRPVPGVCKALRRA